MPERVPRALIVPFAYVTATRMRSLRAFGYNALMAWVPAFGLLLADGRPVAGAMVDFALGYLAFIAIYECGYLANDLWDARRDPAGRHRLAAKPGVGWLSTFVGVRICLFVAIAALTDWWRLPSWSGGFAVLVIAFAAHNMLSPPWRLATFPVLALLRFLLPVAAVLPARMWPPALVIASLLYTTPRWLAYAESKNMIAPSLRQRPRFRSLFLVALTPLVAIGSWWAESTIPFLALGYYLALTLIAEPRPGATGRRA